MTRQRDLDAEIGAAWSRYASGVQIPVMSIPRIYREIKAELAQGVDIETAVKNAASRHKVQS
ncbi:MAG: hypothetical protein ACYS5V_14900 [Planctomycetota bacterium]|jgi:hypothetical protein